MSSRKDSACDLHSWSFRADRKCLERRLFGSSSGGVSLSSLSLYVSILPDVENGRVHLEMVVVDVDVACVCTPKRAYDHRFCAAPSGCLPLFFALLAAKIG